MAERRCIGGLQRLILKNVESSTEREFGSQVASAKEDVGRMSAHLKKCEPEIERLQSELATLGLAKLEVSETSREVMTEMDEQIMRLKPLLKTGEQKGIELKEDLEASQTRERNLIREMGEINETVIKASEEL
ncbi:hypothetical protein J3458_016230 [Metarhizium acridum]|uniref:Uncharacterized protein n=1 Tax=Metarhizium acridum (strain CQMa 102) TaxID=655827 RepID=E9E776_METAQ|nr:uncharacterized protein MAC_05724 [Metarhizium acridum CQMa 102]EFY88251.1 hypothetical protein MAC_05724 [Metarhizium acridum CQMa 102]KAG8409287.1 hypothetical protein J3458_019402 [Metarhizium acridum]KAG8411120.1 hypothetical protein J3458_016230 [Metarhizium acridum]